MIYYNSDCAEEVPRWMPINDICIVSVVKFIYVSWKLKDHQLYSHKLLKICITNKMYVIDATDKTAIYLRAEILGVNPIGSITRRHIPVA
jgi:hypothetical protein